LVNGVTLIIGGKALLENATIKLVRGKKYGLIGRNGIGKTMMINSISRGEIEKFPSDIHMLQVEQEVVGDDETVLSHILACDVERTDLLEDLELLKNED
jgi:ATP-binding cassette subfamily F protein 3